MVSYATTNTECSKVWQNSSKTLKCAQPTLNNHKVIQFRNVHDDCYNECHLLQWMSLATMKSKKFECLKCDQIDSAISTTSDEVTAFQSW